jgi:hypothetical protein
LSRQRTKPEGLTTAARSIAAFFVFIELFAFNDQLYEREEPIRKFLFDKLRFPLLGFPHAKGEIERNPY